MWKQNKGEVQMARRSYPDGMEGIKVDTVESKPVSVGLASGVFYVKCTVKNTNQEPKDAAKCEWINSGGSIYLQVNNATVHRYIGVTINNSACWGLWTPTGRVNAVVVKDGSIYLSGKDEALYPQKDWVYWGAKDSILKCEFVPA
jgi:hypothetical protein